MTKFYCKKRHKENYVFIVRDVNDSHLNRLYTARTRRIFYLLIHKEYMPNAYKENLRYFQQAYQTKEYPWSRKSCVLVERYLEKILSQSDSNLMIDLGCGEGANVIMAAQKGLYVIGIDREPLAVQAAKKNSQEISLDGKAEFLVSDVLVLPFASRVFDIILDHGCLHHLRKSDWKRYQGNIEAILKPRGYYMLEVFSTNHRGYGRVPLQGWHIKEGAYRRFFTKEDIMTFWGDRFQILDIQEKEGEVAGDWHVLMKRNY